MFNFADGVGSPFPRDVIIGREMVVRSIKNSFDIDETVALGEELLKE